MTTRPPVTARTVLAEHEVDTRYCGESSGTIIVDERAYLCVRPEGHDGAHAAVIAGTLVAVWGGS